MLAAEARRNHPDYRSGMNILHDVRDIHFPPDLLFSDMSKSAKDIMKKYDPERGECREALVVDDGYGYAKVHQFIVSGRFTETPVERAVFRELDKAREWLGIPEDYEITYPDSEETA